eukprot:maker-scaffold111_size354240-snap-gene-2.28 protein:Tk11905 transcript:maker-scaffold111_size354240-snap-gene-2.28-mRNA-1 annotation:"protein tamozhennic"
MAATTSSRPALNGHHPRPSPATPAAVASTAELWLKIDHLHLNYLRAEESSRKMDIRRKLQGYLHQYLCLVPHERKFCNPLTAQILSESVRWLAGFSAVKAAQAFEALETYAANLLNQPWRGEFKEIKQYGGFYQHHVDQALSGAERLFTLMGYRATGQDSLSLAGPIEADAVTRVARDCRLAAVECQILISIVHGVSAQFPCTWTEALDFRREHIGTPEQAIRAIVYRQNQHSFRQGLTDAGSTTTQGGAFNPFQPLASPAPPSTTNGFHPPAPAHTMQPGPNGSAIPTGRLVELEAQAGHRRASSPGARSDASYPQTGPIPITVQQLEEENRRHRPDPLPEGFLDSNDQSWDYVYRQLEHNGYTKDQAERPDVLTLLSKVSLARQRGDPSVARHEVLSPLSLEERELLQQIQRTQLASSKPMDPGQPPVDEVDAVHRRFRRNSGDRQRDSSRRQSHNPEKRRSSRHSRPLSPPDVNDGPQPAKDVWQCYACTYSNPLKVEVCEMCGKSRNSPDLMSTSHATSPGDSSTDQEETVACQKCTLLNDRKLKVCEACGASLHKKRIID